MIRFMLVLNPPDSCSLCAPALAACVTVTILSDPRLLCICVSPHLISTKGDCGGNMVTPRDRTEGQVQGGLWQLVGWLITVSWWQTMLCFGNLLSTNPSGVYFFLIHLSPYVLLATVSICLSALMWQGCCILCCNPNLPTSLHMNVTFFQVTIHRT